ncbi:MAG: potassium channel family protein [Candidatus Gracilibacteria bacterium]|jgi:hypothetical protein
MDFQEAVRRIEERGDYNRYADVKPFFEEELKRLPKDSHIERALCYYYLLASYLKAQLVSETVESIDFYERMDEAFMAQEEEFRKDKKRFSATEIPDFYQLMERCYGSLEFLYERHNFKLREHFAYLQKMRFRKKSYLYARRFVAYGEYVFFELTSGYGNSLLRWAGTTVSFVLFFALLYWSIDALREERMIAPGLAHLFDYFYFSAVVTTTLGLGDIVPLSELDKFLMSVQSLSGFLMLGIFVGMLQRKF